MYPIQFEKVESGLSVVKTAFMLLVSVIDKITNSE